MNVPAGTTIDLRAKLKPLYRAAKAPEFIEVPALTTVCVDGAGAPASDAFQAAVQALYTCAYTLKFHGKKQGIDWPVMPLETLWFAADGGPASLESMSTSAWKAFIVVPELVTPAMLEEVRAQCVAKVPSAAAVRVERFDEGRCAQVLHVGPYAAEPETVARLEAFIAAAGLAPTGKHHEIYLSDPRRSAPEKLRTIIRYSVQ